MNYSKQREIIYNLLLDCYTHPTAQQVYDMAIQVMPNISKGTVYRNLSQLVAEGMVRRIDVDEGEKRYDAHLQSHAHFRCTKCGRVDDVELKSLNSLYQDYVKTSSNKITTCEVVMLGVCKDCSKK